MPKLTTWFRMKKSPRKGTAGCREFERKFKENRG